MAVFLRFSMILLLTVVGCRGAGDSSMTVRTLTGKDLRGERVSPAGGIFSIEGFLDEEESPLFEEGLAIALRVPSGFAEGRAYRKWIPVYLRVDRLSDWGGVQILGKPDVIGPLSLGWPWQVRSGRKHLVRVIGTVSLEPFAVNSKAFFVKPYIIEVLWTFGQGLSKVGGLEEKCEDACRRELRCAPEKSSLTSLLAEAKQVESKLGRVHCLRCILFAGLYANESEVAREALTALRMESPLPADVNLSDELLRFFQEYLETRDPATRRELWWKYVGEVARSHM